MDAPPVQYAKTSDGYDIAYCEAGSGQAMVLGHGSFSHVEYAWRFYAPWYQGLAARFHLVWYDTRSQGLSERGLRPELELSDLNLDLAAVLDACRLKDVVLLCLTSQGHVAVRYALKHPERVKAVILLTASITMQGWGRSFHQDVSRENWDFYLRGLVPLGLSPEAANTRLGELRESTTPEDWQIMMRVLSQSDISSEAASLTTPALILHPRNYQMLHAEEGRKLAALIPSARFVPISGDTLYGDAREGIAAIESFLSNLPSTGEPGGGAATKDRLSAREVEVLILLAAGNSNQQIADELVISLNTVNRHVSNIYAKTGVANRAEAATYAAHNGIA